MGNIQTLYLRERGFALKSLPVWRDFKPVKLDQRYESGRSNKNGASHD
jgi:hypothetical protein